MIINYKIFEGIVQKAKKVSKEAHSGQYRKTRSEKGKKLDYFVHPQSVANIIKKLKNSSKIKELISAAYLHDVVEDSEMTIEDIEEEFGELIASLVDELTSQKEKIRKIGKEEYLTQKILKMTDWALIIKLADRLDNIKDIPELIEKGNEKQKEWAENYAKQTNSIINTLEKERNLSIPQQEIVNKIKEKIEDYI